MCPLQSVTCVPLTWLTRCCPQAMYDGGSCSDLGSAAPLDLKRGQLMSARHTIKEELAAVSGSAGGVGVEWPAGCGYRLPSWGAAASPFDPLKSSSVERVKVPPTEMGRDRAYFSPGLYLGREPLPAPAAQREAAESHDKRLSGGSTGPRD